MQPSGEDKGGARSGWAPSARLIRLLAPVEAARAARRRLADLLEEIADSLPDRVGPVAAAAAAELMRAHAERGEGADCLFSAFLAARLPEGHSVTEAAALAAAGAARARCRALEIAEALERPQAGQADALGYMLRCWFEAQRVALSWEETAILRPGCAALGEAALAEFVERPGLRLVETES